MALSGVSLEIAPGERLALVGENGAGKSTLMNVLYGMVRPDEGQIRIDGQDVVLRSPRDAIGRGIQMVHQHFMLIPALTVAENVVLGSEPRRLGLLDLRTAEDQVAATCAKFGFKLDPRAKIETLSVGSQQKVEIAKALHRGARVLILDEPTAVLTPQETEELFLVTRDLAAQGHAIVLIGHKLKELIGAVDRIAVMRRGRKVAELKATETRPDEIAAWMVGGSTPLPVGRQGSPRAAQSSDRLRIRDLHALGDNGVPALRGVSLEVRSGEIVGIAGVDGNGQRELAEIVTGLRVATRGTIHLDDRDVTLARPFELRGLGVAHIPEDRHRRGMIAGLSVGENLALGKQDRAPFARRGLIDFHARRQRAEELVQAYDVRPPDPSLKIGALSGGNQQKVIVARELGAAARLIVVVQPTRGLDFAALEAVHQRLREARAGGAAILLISLDLDEVLALSDRLYVLHDGAITGEARRGSYDERQLGRWMLGTREDVHG